MLYVDKYIYNSVTLIHNISYQVTLFYNIGKTVTYLTLLFSLQEPRKSISSGPEEN